MVTKDLIMMIDKPSFTVKLNRNLLEVELKEDVKKELEDIARARLLEANPVFRGSLGILFQSIVPLDVQLKDIESVEQDEKGQVKIIIPHRKDITIPLEPNESKKLISKLNELIPIEKQRKTERIIASEKAEKEHTQQKEEERVKFAPEYSRARKSTSL